MISNFSEETQEILNKAKLEMSSLCHPYVGTEHLVLAILNTDNELSKKLAKYNLTYNRFKKEILKIIGKGSKKSDFFLHTPLLKKVIENAILDSKDNNNGLVTPSHLFSALLDVGEGIAIRIFIGMNLNLDDMYDEFNEKVYEHPPKNKLLVEELGINLNELAKNNQIDPVIGREKEIHALEQILCRKNKNNPLLIGEPGVGKTAIVEGLATLISKDSVPSKLLNKKIISLDMASAVAGTKYRGEFEERMKKILNEIEKNDDIILFIDEIHTLIGAGGAEGAIDASNILKPALARGKIRCIGATTNDEYKKHFEKDKALERRFQTITVNEPTIEETKTILHKLKPIYEAYHKVTISDDIIDKITTLTDKYIYDHFRPDKQLDILDEVCSKVGISNHQIDANLKELKDKKELYIKNNNLEKAYEYKIKETNYKNNIQNNKETNIVTIEDIAHVINNKSKIPIYEILKDNRMIIMEIEAKLKTNIIGQDKAIDKLMQITKRIKLGYQDNKCLSLLFIGPTGCGKTLLATTYGSIFGDGKTIKVDMSEYSDSTSISKFIGSNPGYVGYDDHKYLLNTIKDNSSATIILDNIDKAHPKIIDLLYQILEDGKILDAKNNLINFSNNLIIMTTNKEEAHKNIGFNENQSEALLDSFNPSFINRIDEIISFNHLDEKSIKLIIKKEIDKLKTKYNHTCLNISPNVTNELTKESNYKIYGARKINKLINHKIENIIIDKIIDNQKTINIDSLFSK